MIGSSWPRTLASPRIQGLAPGTRVVLAGTPSTSRVSSRATRNRSPAMRSATPTHSRPSRRLLAVLRGDRAAAALELGEQLERPVPQGLELDFRKR